MPNFVERMNGSTTTPGSGTSPKRIACVGSGHVAWWQEMDSREGEKLVLQERVAELETAVRALVPGPRRRHRRGSECRPIYRANANTASGSRR
jgi:hypothetical protein